MVSLDVKKKDWQFLIKESDTLLIINLIKSQFKLKIKDHIPRIPDRIRHTTNYKYK